MCSLRATGFGAPTTSGILTSIIFSFSIFVFLFFLWTRVVVYLFCLSLQHLFSTNIFEQKKHYEKEFCDESEARLSGFYLFVVSPVGGPAAGPILVIMPCALRREHMEKFTFAIKKAFSERQYIFAAKLTKRYFSC